MASDDIGLSYATALIDSLQSDEEIKKTVRDLEAFGQILKKVPALTRVLDYPGMPIARRKEILDETLAALSPQKKTQRFLHLVLDNGRVRNLGAILATFGKLSDDRLGLARAEVITARPVEAAARKGWEAALSRLTGRKVRVEYTIDPAVVGGAVAKVGSVVYDGSVKKQLARIRGVLLGQ